MTKIHSNKMLWLHKNLLVIVMVFLFPFYVIGLVMWGSNLVSAQLGGGAIGVFGGKIGGVVQCTCGGGYVISVGPPRAGAIRIGPGTQIFEYKQTKRPGVWVLGTYTPPGLCKKRVGKKCVPVPHIGTAQLIGTSL